MTTLAPALYALKQGLVRQSGVTSPFRGLAKKGINHSQQLQIKDAFAFQRLQDDHRRTPCSRDTDVVPRKHLSLAEICLEIRFYSVIPATIESGVHLKREEKNH